MCDVEQPGPVEPVECDPVAPGRAPRPETRHDKPSPSHGRVALAAAARRASRYNGPNPRGRPGHHLSPAGVDLTRSIVGGSLHAAPQPVAASWVKFSLAVVGGLVAAAETDRVPLVADTVLAVRVRSRYLHHHRADLAESTRGTYRSRLDLVASAVLDRFGVDLARLGLGRAPVTAPGAPPAEAALLAWAAAARPESRRHRLLAVLGLGLGCGVRLGELVRVRGGDVTRDRDGSVVVAVTDDAGIMRRVTCRASWEEVVHLGVPADGSTLLVAPGRATLTRHTLSSSLARAAADDPPAGFSPTELRHTWLVRHLEAGTPLSVLLPAAGLDGLGHLGRLLPEASADPRPGHRLRAA